MSSTIDMFKNDWNDIANTNEVTNTDELFENSKIFMQMRIRRKKNALVKKKWILM